MPDDRRHFVKTTSTVAAGAAVMGAPGFAASRMSPNDRMRVAIVGLRGRGRSHIECFEKLAGKNVEIAAMVDTDPGVLAQRTKEHTQRTGKTPKTYDDMRRVLEDDSIHALSFATPNHWHSLGSIWACQAGKDVYVEKPLSQNVFEGRKLVEAARKYDRIVQHGTQNRSSPNVVEGIQKLREGVIGKIYMARALAFKWRTSIGPHKEGPVPKGVNYDVWMGPAREKPFSNLRYHNKWHWQWEYGNGEIGNQGVHQLDMIRWALGLDAHPSVTQSMGGKYLHEDAQETPNIQTANWQWDGRDVLVEFEARPWISNGEAGIGDKFTTHSICTGVTFYGTEGYMTFPHYTAYFTYLGRDKRPGPFKEDKTDKIANQPHFDNFVEAVRARKRGHLTADVHEGHMSSTMAHLANIAYRTHRTVYFDDKSESIRNDEEQAKLLTRTYRAPYVVTENV